MIAATPDGWALTQKGKDYVAHYAPEVASRSGKPMVVINTTAPQPMQKNVITSVSHNKLTMGMPTKGGRPTKYWTLLNLINKAGSLPLDEINERGFFATLKGLMSKESRTVQYNRITRMCSLTQKGIDYINQHSSTVSTTVAPGLMKHTLPHSSIITPPPVSQTVPMAPMGTPTSQYWTVINGVTINFATAADALAFALANKP